jgi:nitrate/TMAO reductase-like tetraheme cytochrome c subunit/mono/diheme cytochrome c family protein
MRKFWQRIRAGLRKFFFPPEGSPRWQRILPYAVLGVLTLIVLSGAVYGWEYTNSPEFCGTACHTMPPEFTSYLTSPHARIDCVDCHIGKGFITTRVTRKAGDIRHIIATTFNTYEFPIRAHQLQPARETCEKCHLPEKFSDDSLREIKQFSPDKDNTPLTTYLVLKTGGGSKREGLGRGIHWHIENQIEYLPLDPEEQEIPYVRVYEDDGSISEYIDIESGINPADVNPDDLVEMDCTTCHNRITHLVKTPEATVDELMNRGIIDPEIPEIRRIAAETYGQIYKTTEIGLEGISAIASFYKTYYPDYYAENPDKIARTIGVLREAYSQSVYPEQNSDWTTHPNNIGHTDSPGCFRCHSGQHLNAEGESIRLECNLCHSIPVVAGPDDFVSEIEISSGPEPDSHKNANWITLHRDVFDPTCSNCHTTDNPGGIDNTSFCSNSACHGNVWEYAGFDAPGLREVLLAQLPPQPTPTPLPEGAQVTFQNAIGPMLEGNCGVCHNTSNPLKGLDLTTYEGLRQGGESGAVIIANDPESSPIIIVQTSEDSHFAQLTSDEISLLEQWIADGALEE